jgi:hypothetical protein
LSIGLVGVSIQTSLRPSAHRLGERRRAARRIDVGERHAELAEDALEEAVGAAVQVVAGDDVVARREQVQNLVVAAQPDAKARPCRAPSSAARLASSAKRVRLCVREYSKPLCSPGPPARTSSCSRPAS